MPQAWPYSLAAWSGRFPLLLQGTAGAGPYATIVVPQSDELWDAMQSDGDDLRTVVARTNALVDYSNDAPSTSARTIANFLVEAADVISADYLYIYWVYYGNAAAANAEGSVTTTTQVVCTEGGKYYPDAASTVLCLPDPPGATVPAQRISKQTTEEKVLWWDLTPALGDGPTIGGRPTSQYRLWRILWGTSGSVGSGLYSAETTRETTFADAAECLITEVDGRFYFGMHLESGVGTSGTDYIAKFVLDFIDESTGSLVRRSYRALVQVRNTFT